MKKFAVYKSGTGYYYYRYFDDIAQLAGTRLEQIVTEEKLPIVADDRGGYFCFNPNDYNFSEIIETDKECPLTLEQMFFKNQDNFKLGWISPDGDTYSCDYTSHAKAAIMIAKKFFPDTKYPERTLGRHGWLKVIDSWNGTEREHGQFVYSMKGKLTNRQINKLFDLGLYDNPEVKEMLADD